jgi:hypothetical protein
MVVMIPCPNATVHISARTKMRTSIPSLLQLTELRVERAVVVDVDVLILRAVRRIVGDVEDDSIAIDPYGCRRKVYYGGSLCSGFRRAGAERIALHAGFFPYDLSQLRAKGLVEKIPHSRRYGLVGKGYAICVAFLKRFEKIYAPLTAGSAGALWRRWLTGGGQTLRVRPPVSTHLDDLDGLLRAIGLKLAA